MNVLAVGHGSIYMYVHVRKQPIYSINKFNIYNFSLAYASPAATTVSEATAPTRPALPTVAVRLPGLAGPPVETNSRVSPNLSRKLSHI